MSGTVTTPRVLRLVGADAVPWAQMMPQRNAPAQPAWAENQSAAKLSPMDARWALAVRVSQMLDGGRVALLAPNKRRTLVRLAEQMGLRTFDAALVIAIVQDAARAGEPLTRSAQDRLAMVRPAAESSKSDAFEVVAMLTAAAFLGALFFSIMRVWLLG